MIAPLVSVDNTTATTISLSWTSAGSEVDSYELNWERDTSLQCPEENKGNATVSGSITNYNLTALKGNSSYIINITATNAAGNASSGPVTGVTKKAGEMYSISNHIALKVNDFN